MFHEDEDEGERGGEGRRGREAMVAHDDEHDMELDEDEGVEAEYDEVLKTAVSQLCVQVIMHSYMCIPTIPRFYKCIVHVFHVLLAVV